MRLVLYDYAYESFSVQYLASISKAAGHDTEVYFDCSMDKDYLGQDFFLTHWLSLSPGQAAEAILALKPGVVGFSVITSFYRNLSRIIAALREKKPGLVILAGGPHPTLAPEKTLENRDIDFAFVGEADYSLPAFLKELESGATVKELKDRPAAAMPGVWNLRDGKAVDRGYGPFRKDLDEVPFPEKDAYYRRNPALRALYTATCSRGCLFSCSYCNSSTLRKRYQACGHAYFRSRSVANVMAELRQAKAKHRPRYIMFLDNLFAPKKEWLREFAQAYRREIDLPFFCETNPNVHDRETLELLAQARCTLLQFGFQSANESVRREILNRHETNARIRELVSRAKELGMFVCVDHIANLPGETAEHLVEAQDLYRELRPDWVNLGFLQYYPGADIVEIAHGRRMLSDEDLPRIVSGDLQSSFRLLSKSTLTEEYRVLPMRLFAAFKLPRFLGDLVRRSLQNRMVARILSPLGSAFIYASRIANALTDRRDFLVRHHILRNLAVIPAVLHQKMVLHD